jgi:hypothetical protein
MASPQLEYQLNFLKQEIEMVNASIRQMDEITKNVKQWAILTWTAAVGWIIATPSLKKEYIGAAALIPVLFWLVDTWHRRIQRKFIWRAVEISQFLNDERFTQSFQEQRIVGFALFEPKTDESDDKKYMKFISWRRIMLFRSLSILYGGLAFLSLIVWLAIMLSTK